MRNRVWSIAGALAIASLISWNAAADSLFTRSAERGGSLVTEPKTRFQPGDLITVLVRERVEASTSADTTTRKQAEVDSQARPQDNPFLTQPDRGSILKDNQLPNWNFETDNETRARGQTTRSSTLTTTIACVVKEVHENGNLVLEGEKQVTVNREDSMLVVRGLVRSKDVTPANTIQSTQMANATVHLKGKGPLWNNQRRGLLTRFVDWFAPY